MFNMNLCDFVCQGVHPEALKKVREPEILEIVEGCIQTKKEER